MLLLMSNDKSHLDKESEKYVTPKEAAKIYNITPETLRVWGEQGKIKTVKTEGGHRRYKVRKKIIDGANRRTSIIYARVSSAHQKSSLDNQIKELREKYPKHRLIKDISRFLVN